MLGIGVGISPTLMQGGGVPIPTAAQVASNLFGAGEPGLMLSEFNTLTNLFQDGPGTIPVTAVGQPVGRVLDLSGRGNFATFSNCTLQQDGSGRNYLAFNGTNTGGLTASIDFTSTAKMTVWVGVMKSSDAAVGLVLELGATVNSVNGTFAFYTPSAPAATTLVAGMRGDTASNFALITGSAAPLTFVQSAQMDITQGTGATQLTTKKNGGTSFAGATFAGAGNFSNNPVYIGRRAGTSIPFSGAIYSLIVRGAATTAPMVSSTELYVNSQTGAF